MDDRRDDNSVNEIYVLDTNSIWSMRFEDLRSASSRAHLAVSPISIFELLCHLDEQNKKGRGAEVSGWSRVNKVNLAKCSLLSLLDDPYAAQADAVGARDLVHSTRFEDRQVLPQLFPALESSSTLDAFYSCEVKYPNGETGLVRNAAARARALLEAEEARYKAHVNKWCALMIAEFGYERTQQFTPVDFVRFAVHAASGLAEHYKDGLPTVTSGAELDLKGPVFSATYTHLGYGIARAIEYLRRAGGNIESLNIDPNDMEDSAICLHLSLVEHRVLVTGDGGTYKAVDQALRNLRAASEALHEPVVAYARVISTDEFKSRLVPTS
ncbi:MAG: hypothetical protein M0R80_28145 [Proteobacteria bacterium]|jgi:hypothetical protein|nr:hypothetical protein [Pseudomonadota bacterium]